MRTLVLFTRDLRVHDHPALVDAVRSSDEVVPLFVLDPALLARSPNRARLLLEGLRDLDRALRGRGGRLILRRGDVAETALRVAREAGVRRVLVTGGVSRTAVSREVRLERELRALGIELRVLPGAYAVEPGAVATSSGGAYRVFTPYYRAWLGAPRRSVLPPPRAVRVPPEIPSEPLPDPAQVRIDAEDLLRGGEEAARQRLDRFLRRGLSRYGERRDALEEGGSSRLSADLRFGFLSATEVAVRAATLPGAEAFLRQLAWRDFYAQLLRHDPRLAWRDLRPGPARPAPQLDPEVALEAWRRGRTGLPLVDAAMRQLWREGWMHNRARMVVASFLARRLAIPWQEGARLFARLLADGDPASNAGNWQWAAGTGTDPRPGRTFNPVRQARRFDPDGTYVRRYVDELADVPPPLIFAPWREPALLASRRYPAPIVPVAGA